MLKNLIKIKSSDTYEYKIKGKEFREKIWNKRSI